MQVAFHILNAIYCIRKLIAWVFVFASKDTRVVKVSEKPAQEQKKIFFFER